VVLSVAVLEETLEPSNELTDEVLLLSVPVLDHFVIIINFKLDVVIDLFAQFILQGFLLLRGQSLLNDLVKSRLLVHLRLQLHQHGRCGHALTVNLVRERQFFMQVEA
jgi:hypothetical protein